MRPDPRIRQNLDRISTSLESAADNARTGCFTFTKSYIEPCFSSLAGCCTSCLPQAKTAHRHQHHRDRYRARNSEFPFAFYGYDDYGSDEDDGPSRGFLAWGNDELDRLLAGSGSGTPSTRNERMFYGTVGDPSSSGLRRKGTMPGRDSPDPTVIPGTSMFGFLSTFGIRGKGMRYKPSAANLQEHPQRGGALDVAFAGTGSGRKRSGTGSSAASQGDSLRSRGDLWPSEDEDDAVVIGDDAFPRSSDGESAEVLGHGFGTDDDDGSRHGDPLAEDGIEDRRRRREHAKRLAMQRGFSAGSMDEGKARHMHSKGPSSAPPTILAVSPPTSVRSQEGLSIHQRSLSPRGIPLRREKEVDMGSDTGSTPWPQMRQVSTQSPMHPSSPSLPLVSESDSAPHTPRRRERPIAALVTDADVHEGHAG